MKVDLVKGPEGMKVNGATVTWEKVQQGDTSPVELKITDDSGKSITQAFVVSVNDAK